MNIEEFTAKYNKEYMITFHKAEVLEKKTVEKPEEKSSLSKISDFLFKPRYEVNNLKFKLVD